MATAQVIYTSPGWVKKYLAHLRRVPTMVLDSKAAALAGATGNNSPQLMRALAGLGIVDEEGRATADLGRRLALDGDEYRKAVKELLARSYPTFTRWLERGDTVTREAVDTELARTSDLGQSARSQAFGLFRFWVRESGDADWIAAAGASLDKPGGARKSSRTAKREPKSGVRPASATRRTREQKSARPDFEDVITDAMPFYRVTVSVLRATRLTNDDWDHMKESLVTKIEHMKKLSRREAGDE